MKKLLLSLILLILSSQAFSSVVLLCAQDDGAAYLGLNDRSYFECTSLRFKGVDLDHNHSGIVVDQEDYSVSFEGVGVGAFAGMGALMINCPTVRRKALGVESFINKKGKKKKGVQKFVGVKA